MRAKALLFLLFGLLEAKLLTQVFGLPAFSQVERQSHGTQESVQMRFATLHRAEGGVPLALFTWLCHGLDILHDGIRQGKRLLELGHDTGFGLPSTACRGCNALCAVEAVIEPRGPAPFPMSACSAHGSPDLDGILYICGCFHHQVDHRVPGANYAESLKLAAWINAYHQGLIVRLLMVGQMDRE